MFLDMTTIVSLLFILAVGLVHHQLAPRLQFRKARSEDYLYKIARLTGKSEYDVFCKSAENWPVSQHMINEDFRAYLTDYRIPYYVNDFIRRHKTQIDALRLPPY
jgi:hypothetical protein